MGKTNLSPWMERKSRKMLEIGLETVTSRELNISMSPSRHMLGPTYSPLISTCTDPFNQHSVQSVVYWEERDVEDILSSYDGTIYDSVNTERRRVVSLDDLRELPLVDEEDNEIPIYTEDGYTLPRRLAACDRNTPCHGVLVDLRNLRTLFPSNHEYDDLFDEEPQFRDTKYYVYPQAGLVTAGHFQADGLVHAFRPLLNDLNNEIMGDMDMPDSNASQPIVGVACQGYNAVMHATRGRSAQHHDAQKGLITSALAGGWACSNKTQQAAERLLTKCNRGYPHEDFRTKISRNGISRDLRLENVFTIDVQSLPDAMQDGRSVIQNLTSNLQHLLI
jgi:hypothetical protein